MAISLARYQVMIHADFTAFRQELRAEAARVTEFKVRPILDVTAFRAQFRVFEAVYLRDRTFNVTPHLNHHTFINSTNATFNQIIHNSNSAGQSSGNSFGSGFLKQWKAIAIGIGAVIAAPLIQPFISILGSLVQAMGAVAAAAPLMLASLALPAATLMVAFKGVGEALKGAFSGDPTKGQEEALANLSRSAREFVRILASTKGQIAGFRKDVQEHFFQPFNQGFRDLVASPAIKQLRSTMDIIAIEAGLAGAAIARALASAANSGQLLAIFRGIRDTFAQLASLAGPLTAMFLTLMQHAQPFMDILTGQLTSGLTNLIGLVDRAAKSGALDKFFNDGATAILQLIRLVVNLVDIVKSVFDGITGGADGALGSLTVLTGQFATFLKTAQGQAILQLFADKLALIGDIIKSVVVPLLPLALQLAQAISGPLGDGIRQILPALENFIKALVDGLSPVLKVIAPLFDELIVVVANFIVLALRQMTAHLDALMPVLLQFAQEIGPHLSPLIQAFGNALIALLPLIPTFTQLLVSLIPLIIKLTPVIVDVIGVTTALITTFGIVIGWIVQVIAWIVSLSQGFTKLGIAMDETGQFFIRVWDAIAAWFTGKIVPSFLKALDDIGGFFAKLGRSIAQAVTDIRNVWDAAWAFLRDTIFNPLNNMITNTIPNAFQRGVDFIGAAWERLRAIARAPVDFFINTVINKGIVGAFNAVAGWIPGLGKVDEVHPAGFASGGQLPGYSDVDNMVAIGPGGKPLALAGGEWIINARQSRKHGGLLNAINSGMDGYADGGIIDAITDPIGWVKGRVNLDGIPGGGRMVAILKGLGTRMIDGLVSFIKDKLFDTTSSIVGLGKGVIGAWPSSPSAQRGDSGVWRTIVAIINATGPISGSFGNAYRPGDPLWHGSGRAVDWMGFNQDALAVYLSLLRPLELIHRTGRRDYAYTRGVNKGSFNNTLMEQHRNHVHIAMNTGGLLPKVFDSGGIWRPGELGVNTGSRNELVVPEGMKISLSDDTIARLGDRIVRGFERALGGGAMAALNIGRARA